jgi:hypothetical protein
MAQSRLAAVREEEAQLIAEEPPRPAPPPPAPRETPRVQSALTGLLLTSLRALSQRAIVALASLVDLALIGSVFALCLMIIAAPTVPQLIGAAGYAVFILIAIFMRGRP